MTKRNRQEVQDRRNEKRMNSRREDIKPQKFQEERQARIVPLSAKNDNQKKALQYLTEKQCLILTGSSGAGKTTLAVWWACNQYLKGNIDNIVFTRGEKVWRLHHQYRIMILRNN